MAIIFKQPTKKAGKVEGAKKDEAPSKSKTGVAGSQTDTGKKPSWYKTSEKAMAAALEKEDERIEKRREDMSRMWRFWLKEGGDARITFVDGDLTSNGLLQTFMFREHRVKKDGEWREYVCVAEQEPCPLCEQGNEASLVGVMTIIDQREVKGKKSVYRNVPRLFVAKRGTLKLLTSLASASKGLRGVTFDVHRSSDKVPNVGDEFTFVQKDNPKELAKHFLRKDEKTKKTIDVFVPAEYEKEIPYLTGAELRKEGFGSSTPIGAEPKNLDNVDREV